MLKLLILTLAFVAISVMLLCVRILFLKNGRFPNTHVGGNKALRKKGVSCVQTQDYMEYHNVKSNHQRNSN